MYIAFNREQMVSCFSEKEENLTYEIIIYTIL